MEFRSLGLVFSLLLAVVFVPNASATGAGITTPSATDQGTGVCIEIGQETLPSLHVEFQPCGNAIACIEVGGTVNYVSVDVECALPPLDGGACIVLGPGTVPSFQIVWAPCDSGACVSLGSGVPPGYISAGTSCISA